MSALDKKSSMYDKTTAICGFPIGKLSPSWQFAVCVTMVFFFYILYGYCQVSVSLVYFIHIFMVYVSYVCHRGGYFDFLVFLSACDKKVKSNLFS